MVKNRLKELREKQGIPQSKIAELTGISIEAIRKIENGEEVIVRTGEIVKLLEFFNVSMSEMFLL